MGKPQVDRMEHQLDWALAACARVLRPVVRLALALGVKHPHLEQQLRQLLLEEAARSWREKGVSQPNISQLSVTTGLNRKAVTAKVRDAVDPLPNTEMSSAAKVFTLWLQLAADDPAYQRLPVTAAGEAPSFESISRQGSRGNLHHRSVLDELVRLKLVSEQDGQVELHGDGFVPAGDLRSMLAFLGDNARDHLFAAVANTLGGQPAFLERAVYARGLGLAEAERIHETVRQRWGVLQRELAREMTLAVHHAVPGEQGRMRIGMYVYYEDESAAAAAGRASEPTQERQ